MSWKLYDIVYQERKWKIDVQSRYKKSDWMVSSVNKNLTSSHISMLANQDAILDTFIAG